MFKKVLSALTAFVFIITAVVSAVPSSAGGEFPFEDVPAKAWYRSEVEFVWEHGLMQGTSSTKFEPESSMTRAMFVTVLCRLCDGEEVAINSFSDVGAKAWYSGYVGWASTSGIVNGYPDGTFRPDQKITRQEVAATLVRYLEWSETRIPRHSVTAPDEFSDAGSIASWSGEYVDTLRRAGIFNGDSAKRFNPNANIKRSEAATLLHNIISVTEGLWNGYVPDSDGDMAVYGAKYLYWNGFIVQGKLGEDLCEDADYPYLDVYPDDTYIDQNHIAYNKEVSIPLKSYEPLDTFGFSVTNQIADLTKTPFVKICYEYVGAEPETIFPAYLSNKTNHVNYRTTSISFERGEDDGGYRTAICDTAAAVGTLNVTFDIETADNVHVMIRPFEGAAEGVGFRVRYIALFATKEAAEAYRGEEHADYLLNYHLDEEVTAEKIDDGTVEEYLALIREKIKEIKESPSSFGPEDVPEGANVWYVSSIHGSHDNDGKSPETPFAGPEDLYKKVGSDTNYIYRALVKKGDYVFFERGSVFYPWRYYNHTIATLCTEEDTYYGAYGDPSAPKPIFKGSYDFGDGCGDWQETEWEDIYVLDLLPLLPEGKENFAGVDGDVGKIIFNDGQYLGVRVFPSEESEHNDVPTEPFGEGKTTRLMYEMGNCDEYFISGGTTARDPGDALRNNLEFLHDRNAGKVYLRCKWGNPADVFESVDVCRVANVGWLADGGHYDNLAFLYSSYICAEIGSRAVVTYCEAGYGGGCVGSVGTGIGGFGYCESLEVDHCYIHDIEDGPMGTQKAGDDSGNNTLNNVILTNNVVITSQNLVELFHTNREEGPDGLGVNKITGARVTGNYGAYIGYGYPRTVNQAAEGLVLHNWYYGEMVDCRFWDNLLVCCEGSVIGAHVGSDYNTRGWLMHDNTYVLNPRICYILRGTDGTLFTNLHKEFLASYKMPYTDRYLSYLVSNGIDYGSKFYTFDTISEGEANHYFVTTGYYVERGIRPR